MTTPTDNWSPDSDLMQEAEAAESESFFSDLGLEDAPLNPNYVPDGKYRGVCFKVRPFKKNTDDGVRKKLIFTWKITDENTPYKGRKIDIWRDADKNDPPERKAWLKRDLVNVFHIEESELSQVTFDDLVGTEAYLTVKNNGDYTNINKIEPISDTQGSGWAPQNVDEPPF